jgi:hypothetical protein
VVLTPEGRAAIEQAAPGHVRTVRSLVFDDLTETEVDVLESALGKMLARLDPRTSEAAGPKARAGDGAQNIVRLLHRPSLEHEVAGTAHPNIGCLLYCL